tara:strand:- start:1526 stop:1813 length:288 start_codon:yes stop_codon:yes gene_type:complete
MSTTTTSNKKYQIHNQLTGALEEAATFADIRSIQERVKAEYFAALADLFTISVFVENEDGSWTQTVSDENGEPKITLRDFEIEEMPFTISDDIVY